jgi:hypothetical protein
MAIAYKQLLLHDIAKNTQFILFTSRAIERGWIIIIFPKKIKQNKENYLNKIDDESEKKSSVAQLWCLVISWVMASILNFLVCVCVCEPRTLNTTSAQQIHAFNIFRVMTSEVYELLRSPRSNKCTMQQAATMHPTKIYCFKRGFNSIVNNNNTSK